MNDHQSTDPLLPSASAAGNYGMLDLLTVLARHKKRVLGLPLAAMVLAAGISMLVPNVYVASTRLLPPQQAQSGAAALLSQLGGAASAVAGAAGIKNPNDVYVAMLKSRTVADRMIARFDLKAAYGSNSAEKTRKLFADDTVIGAGKDGLISIEVASEDQKKVAEIANGYVDELMKLTKVLALTEAAQRRLFFEQQLETTKNNLAAAELAFKGAVETHGVISVDAESRALVETMGLLRAKVSAKEIELGAMKSVMTENNPEYKRVVETLASLRAELFKLENGRPNDADVSTKGTAKQAGLENIKILRDIKYQQMLYELLAKQYEVARLDEAKDSALIQVLDPAIEPERKTRPMRGLIVLLAGVFGLLVAVAWAFVLSLREQSMQEPMQAEKWARLRASLRFR